MRVRVRARARARARARGRARARARARARVRRVRHVVVAHDDNTLRRERQSAQVLAERSCVERDAVHLVDVFRGRGRARARLRVRIRVGRAMRRTLSSDHCSASGRRYDSLNLAKARGIVSTTPLGG